MSAGQRLITRQTELEQFCAAVNGSEVLGFDTEFVSENLYRPQLCLVQAAVAGQIVLIDSLAVEDMRPFWRLVSEGIGTVVAHAAREEFLFCHRAIGARPANLFDLQIAAGFVGHDFPAAYSTLVSQIMGKTLSKGETRTDWRQRPLSQRQIQYALQDVEHLEAMYRHLRAQLEKRGRLAWFQDEMTSWQEELEAIEAQPAWSRLSGLARLSRRGLAIAGRLAGWRDQVAREADRSPRRVLPDDLLVEIAKRGESDPVRLKAIRGLTNRVNPRHLPDIGRAVNEALMMPEHALPPRVRTPATTSLGVLGQFLQTGLNLICMGEQIAPGLVANAQDVRDLAARLMGQEQGDEPLPLEQGWRGEIIGQSFGDLLDGRLAMRIARRRSDQPLELVPWPPAARGQ